MTNIPNGIDRLMKTKASISKTDEENEDIDNPDDRSFAVENASISYDQEGTHYFPQNLLHNFFIKVSPDTFKFNTLILVIKSYELLNLLLQH